MEWTTTLLKARDSATPPEGVASDDTVFRTT